MRKKRWSPELERKVKDVIITAKNRDDAYRALLKGGFNAEEADRVLQRFYKSQRANIPASSTNLNNNSANGKLTDSGRTILSSHEQQLELIAFSQNVRLLFKTGVTRIFL